MSQELRYQGKQVFVLGVPRRFNDFNLDIRELNEILYHNRRSCGFRFVGVGRKLSCANIIDSEDGVHLTKSGLRQLRTIIMQEIRN